MAVMEEGRYFFHWDGENRRYVVYDTATEEYLKGLPYMMDEEVAAVVARLNADGDARELTVILFEEVHQRGG